MQPISNIVAKALTATRALQTPEKPVNTQAWANWAKFDLWGDEANRAELSRMICAMARFVQELKVGTSPPRWLSFLGGSGVGKTYLARRIWRWYASTARPRVYKDRTGRDEIQYPGQWCFWPSLAGELAGNEGYDVLRELESERLVVFDEIGADRDASGHLRDCLARTLCARVGKWTIITSNKTLARVGSDIDTRITSRMIRDGSAVVEVDLPDYEVWKVGK
jgi:DNA replication protein DnaC